jgi:hypothetical protein
LVKAIFSVANLKPAFLSSGLNPRALVVLSDANPPAIFGAQPLYLGSSLIASVIVDGK